MKQRNTVDAGNERLVGKFSGRVGGLAETKFLKPRLTDGGTTCEDEDKPMADAGNSPV